MTLQNPQIYQFREGVKINFLGDMSPKKGGSMLSLRFQHFQAVLKKKYCIVLFLEIPILSAKSNYINIKKKIKKLSPKVSEGGGGVHPPPTREVLPYI